MKKDTRTLWMAHRLEKGRRKNFSSWFCLGFRVVISVLTAGGKEKHRNDKSKDTQGEVRKEKKTAPTKPHRALSESLSTLHFSSLVTTGDEGFSTSLCQGVTKINSQGGVRAAMRQRISPAREAIDEKFITGRPRSVVVQSWGCAEEAVGRGGIIISHATYQSGRCVAPMTSDGLTSGLRKISGVAQLDPPSGPPSLPTKFGSA
ncbi:hypothetical protein F4818DRAFT_147699 [Hypoxylon cercidicola]|nr:hypothetical protein F4818DRAFT_147699 [Hypoxylon cercidicola]